MYERLVKRLNAYSAEHQKHGGITAEAADAIEELEEKALLWLECGKFEALERLSTAWHGKQYYFGEDDGTIYSRESGVNMTLDEAIEEFCNTLGDDGSI